MTTLYIPSGAVTLDKSPVEPQIRLLIQGAPGVGKTWAALTFPNPVVVNVDRGLGAHIGRSDVVDVPIYDGNYCDKIVKRDGSACPPNRKDTIMKFLATEALKLSPAQTLVLDGLTNIDSAFETQFMLNPPTTDAGKYDKFAIWRERLVYYSEMFDYLTSLPCNVVMICHETADRDAKGELNGKMRTLLQGQFADKIVGKFTDCFRSHVFEKPKTPEQMAKACAYFGCDIPTIKAWCAASVNECIYLWQTQSDDRFNGKASSLVAAPKYIWASYDSMIQYRRKIS